ncbi:DUF3126 family protein [Rhodospirillum rubrum]|uniref:DUF3126 family protein n=1 Tax=Rhodospirillum rubrum (strain ATCC 11170 / ATH 1.1.1 / DSM 467 / LMG 4362 / NCIMB 8255 / S1) TaxID=269796 RepID=Q2RSW2_RHORT|nr:DUF3126 family protein [Rhodospirillum rubrum]ABC22783.1 conserved hypothetical protein [Rhodospirillum rubrum ATCC 11170]AEO48504.1 hypothetical protein F11_10190 [Rhodospirillum rubrum F11]MBK1665918.1 DUF3126 domain-containing protein [Rhodospirillum rubrum]MBK1678026.1 DUF3126 domain-containing protein [Rhodospirillum rubrum]MBK5954380.1 hypothetical protein [Rhodospirillum rubrum]
MTAAEIRKVEAYLRRTFATEALTLTPPPKAGGSCEVLLKGEFIGTLNRDEDEGEVSYAFNMVILDLDL